MTWWGRAVSYLFSTFFGAGLAGGAAAAFSPSDIAGLVGWWDFSDATTLFQLSNGTTAVTADTDPIGYATDKSGTGTHIVQVTAGLRPTYRTNVKNSRAVARFDGADDFLAAALVQAQPFTAFIVCRFVANGAPVIAMAGTSSSECAIYYNNGGQLRTYAGTEQNIEAEDTNYRVVAITMNGASSVARLNAVNKALAGSPGANTLTNISIGAYQSGASPSQIDVGEALIYDGAVSGANVALVETYLNGRWAVYV